MRIAACGLLMCGLEACASRSAPTILLYDGTGTSPNDVAAVERILETSGLSFATASSRELNAMSESQLGRYRLLIFPGGNFVEIGVARYPDGTPAIVEGSVGDGWVILLGIHPEAPESWRRGLTFTTSARDDNAYAARLINAALNRTRLEHY